MKYSIKNISFNTKRLLLIFSFIYLTSLISSSFTKTSLENVPQKRNLSYNIGSIYYELLYPLNDLTGTGDRLKDVPYKVQCKLLKCESGCCVGEIDKMRCGPDADCAIYLDSVNVGITQIVVPVVVGLFLIFLILVITFKIVFKFSICASICLSLGCISIVLIPFVIYFICKEKKNVTEIESLKDG